MSITVTDQGPNSCVMVHSAGETLVNIIAAIGAWLVNHGWVLHDATANVYRAVCKDGITYKYIQLFPYSGIYLTFRTYESWNASTHIGTNEAGYILSATGTATVGSQVTYAPLDINNGGKVRLFATNRYALFSADSSAGAINARLNGCIEWQVANVDTGGVPFAWMTFDGMIGSFLYTNGYVNSMCPPRIGGSTLAAAARVCSVAAGVIQNQAYGSNQRQLYNLTPQLNDPATGLPISYDAKVNLADSTGLNIKHMGKLYGLKFVCGAIIPWINDDTIQIKCDAESMQDKNGTIVNHAINRHTYNNQAPALALPV